MVKIISHCPCGSCDGGTPAPEGTFGGTYCPCNCHFTDQGRQRVSDEIKVERWEDEDFIITVNGKPVGHTLSQFNAKDTATWLASAIKEITESALQSAREKAMEEMEQELKNWAVRNGFQFGCGATHAGVGTTDCPRRPHHHHDNRCEVPWETIRAKLQGGKGK